MFLLGTIVNTLAVIVGALIGVLVPKVPERFSRTAMQGLSLAVIWIGLSMALSDEQDVLLIIISLVLGALLGEWLDIDGALARLGQMVEKRAGKYTNGKVAEAFVTASLLYCVGSMAVVGAIQSGFQLNNHTLYAKSMLDGISSVVFTSTLGLGAALAAIPLFLYEGSIATISWLVGSSLNDPAVIACMTAAGGLLVVGIGLNLLGAAKVSVGNLLPGVFVAPLLKWLLPHLAALTGFLPH